MTIFLVRGTALLMAGIALAMLVVPLIPDH